MLGTIEVHSKTWSSQSLAGLIAILSTPKLAAASMIFPSLVPLLVYLSLIFDHSIPKSLHVKFNRNESFMR